MNALNEETATRRSLLSSVIQTCSIGELEDAVLIAGADTRLCSTMAGKPFKVGRFAHTLRIRLMREHLGVDVDSLYEEDLMASEPLKEPHEQEPWDPEDEQQFGDVGVTRINRHKQSSAARALWHDTADGVKQGMWAFCCSKGVVSREPVVNATGEIGSTEATKVLRKVGVRSHGIDASAGDKYLDEERQMYSRTGEKEPGFPSSVVPTLEEKIVREKRPKQRDAGTPIYEALEEEDRSVDQHNHDAPVPNGDTSNGQEDEASLTAPNGQARTQNGHVERHGSARQHEPHQARVETGELYGAPADASIDPQHDDQVPHARSGKIDADEEEEKAPGTRAILRKHLTAKLGNKQWQLPTPTPHVDPYGFEDPISDAFWKDVWVACAVHNV